MKQIPLFSLVIFPTIEQQNLIASYKNLLKENIGWYASANSTAHITIINLENEFLLELYINQIEDYCKTIIPKKVKFNSLKSFGQNTFFISPNEESQHYLDNIIINLHNHLGYKINNAHAHISIARKLDEMKIKKAYQSFSSLEINFEFICDCIYIRKFNNNTKQYTDIIKKIDFK
jgi:hypothetical protein